jgi:hypothetical protein
MNKTEIIFQLIAKIKKGELNDSLLQDLEEMLLTPSNEIQEDSYDEYLIGINEIGDESELND